MESAELTAVYVPDQTDPLNTIPLYLFMTHFNPLKAKRRPLYLKTQSVPRSKHFSSVIKTAKLCCMGQTPLFVLR
jgi:hypothetical protein